MNNYKFELPTEFSIAGGKIIKVLKEDILESGSYGDFCDIKSQIRIAENIKLEGVPQEISDEDIERTYYHELIHCFNYFYNCECDEALAQTFSNFMYEYMHSKK